MFEDMFVRHLLNDPTLFEYYKQEVSRYIENHPGISNDFTNDRFPIGTEAIIIETPSVIKGY